MHPWTLVAAAPGPAVDWPAVVLAGLLAWIAVGVTVLAYLARVAPTVASDVKTIIEATRGNGAGTTVTVTRPAQPTLPTAHGAGALAVTPGTGGNRLTSLPLWSQLTDRNPDGQLPAQRVNDCGEECVAIVTRATRGVEQEADYLRYLLRGAEGSGLTSADDLVTLLGRSWQSAHVLVNTSAQALAAIRAALGQGRPTIVLGRWVDPSIQHWVIPVAVGAVHIDYLDPWCGGIRTRTIVEWSAFYAGTMVVTDEPARYPPA